MAVLAALALTGCGVGFGPGGKSGNADLTVTRDYGHEVLTSVSVDGLSQSSTAMRLLDRSAEIETRYGGGFVQAIAGITGSSGTRSSDWFYFVNGITAERGAAEFVVNPGDRMWWDFRDWTDAMDINAVVGAYPAPMSTGYDGENWPVVVECRVPDGAACDLVEDRLSDDGIGLDPGASAANALRILVGAWPAIESDPAASRLDSAPSASGVFARFGEPEGSVSLDGLDASGEPVARLGAGAGLIAATRNGAGPPVWLVTGTDSDGVEQAAAALGEANLKNRYAALVFDGRIVSVPFAGRGGEATR